jgi:hypothetical protein
MLLSPYNMVTIITSQQTRGATMRTDLVSAYLIHEWLEEYLPEMAAEWQLEVDDQVKRIAQMMKDTVSNAKLHFTVQHLVAKAVIEDWDLKDVVLLGGGTPTPLAPKPDQLLYWTDKDPDAVAEAAASGYNSRQVDVRQVDQLSQLPGARTAIALGLMHFLPDPAVPAFLNNLSAAGFEVAVFNQGNRNEADDLATTQDEYKKLGAELFVRNSDELIALMPDNWHVEIVIPIAEAVRSRAEINNHLANLPHRFDVYRVVTK